MYNVLILGAGAGGLMCASRLALPGKVGLIDANNAIAQKIKISGGGRCNITNTRVSADDYEGDVEFVSTVLSQFGKDDLLRFLAQNALRPVLKDKEFYFCKTSSDEIISLFKRLCQRYDYLLNQSILHVKKENGIFAVTTDRQIYRAKHLVVATGGKSFTKLGASDIGLQIASGFGLQVKSFAPALVGLTLQKEQFWMKELSGISADVAIVVDDKKISQKMLFTHKGISGPAVLNASLYWKRGGISIDFVPNIDIDKLIKKSKKLLSSTLPIAKRLAVALLNALDIPDIACQALTPKNIQILNQIHNYTFAPAGNFGFSKAEVSTGGVCIDEIDPATMMSRKVDKLYFVAEVLDVTGRLGGYNFQWAFSSGAVCGDYIKKNQNS